MIRRKTLEKEPWQIELEKLPDEINVVGYYTPDKYKANPRLGVFGVCYGDTFKMSDIFNRDALRPKKGFDETVMFIGLEKGRSYGRRPSSYVAWFKMQPKDESLVRTDGSIFRKRHARI